MINNQQDRSKHKELLELFENKTDFKKEEYYGTMFMKYKKNNMYQIKLIYDFKKNAITSESVMVKGFDKAIKILQLLEKFAIDGNQPTKADSFSFDDDSIETTTEIFYDSEPVQPSLEEEEYLNEKFDVETNNICVEPVDQNDPDAI